MLFVSWRLMMFFFFFFFFSSRRRHTRLVSDWSSDVCSSDPQHIMDDRRHLRQVISGHPGEELSAMPRANPELISPTAHYTGNVWLQHGLSHPAFATLQGQAFYYALKAPMAMAKGFGAPTLETFLLARHRLIDLQLENAIASGEITQIIEIAAGLSPRGWRFASRHRERITYIEADLVD